MGLLQMTHSIVLQARWMFAPQTFTARTVSDAEENEIEFLLNDERATATLSQVRFINKIKKMAEEYPGEVVIIADNKNKSGNTVSLCASLPVSWIVKPGKPAELNLTDEQRDELRERLLRNTNRLPAKEAENPS